MNGSELLQKYFPDLSSSQQLAFKELYDLYVFWNQQINVVSRKDIESLYEKHVLHSLAIAKVMEFQPGTHVLDVGTGGGFPGIPLAILFPEASFHLVDSIGKKIKVVEEVAKGLSLKNVKAEKARAEELNKKYHFVVSRAVTAFPEFYAWVKNKFLPESFNALPNGILYLKGGDLEEELKLFEKEVKIFSIPDFFEEPFFETKKVVYFPAPSRRNKKS